MTHQKANGIDDLIHNESGSLCPAAKAADTIGDKWVLLLLRELFLGGSRYSDFSRALPRISPTVLSKRLKSMEMDGLIVKKMASGEKSAEYRLTKCGRELGPLIDMMAKWGLRWVRRRLAEEDLDVGGFMWDFHRTLNTSELPDGETVFCVQLTEVEGHNQWWLIVKDSIVDLCMEDPGKDVDVFITGKLHSIVEIWMGDSSTQTEIDKGDVILSGQQYLIKSAQYWFPVSRYSDIRPERFIGKNR